jgi:hypothetical protein
LATFIHTPSAAQTQIDWFLHCHRISDV